MALKYVSSRGALETSAIDGPLRHEQAEASAEGGEQQRFGHELADERGAWRAQRGPHRDLAIAAGVLHEQQVGDVGAGDEQHERHGAGEQVNRVVDRGVEEADEGRCDPERPCGGRALRGPGVDRAGFDSGPGLRAWSGRRELAP